MEVGIVYESVPMECDSCGAVWRAVVEVSKVVWFDGLIEYGYTNELECPNCGMFVERTDNDGQDS